VPPGSMDGGRVVDQSAVGQSLRTLIARSDVTATRALIAVSDALASFRVLSFPKDTSDVEVDAQVAAQLNLGSERLASRHVDVPASSAERTVYAAVWDRAQVDAIAGAARIAGLEPVVVDLKSLCLARALGVDSALLVDITVEPGEVVLIDHRIPRIRHTFKLPADSDSAEAIADALKAVVGFHHRSSGTGLMPTSPVLVRSIQPLSSLVARRLAEITGRLVEAVAHPARIDQGIRFAPFVTCVGLMMRRGA
jgi:hypothetical protein